MLLHLITYLVSFIGIWIGAGLAIKSVERLSRRLRLSSFSVSFIVLGFFTSISEFSVGVNAVLENDPEIYVGNLIGASIVLFLLVIPLLALIGHNIKINREFTGRNLLMSLVVVSAPTLLSIDGTVTRFDALIAMVLFMVLLVWVEARKGLLERVKDVRHKVPVQTMKELATILVGVAIIFTASHFVVEETMYFSELLSLSPFLISLLVIAIGTNIPELSLVIRSVFLRSNQVAFGDYVGSASVNTFLFGLLTVWHGKPVQLTNSYLISLSFLIVGLIAFYYFARTKNSISRMEGFALLSLYVLFLITEIALH